MSGKSEEVNVDLKIDNVEPTGEPTCEIYFENNQNCVYYAGQVVNGCVNLAINDPITVKAIYSNMIGQGHCEWTTSSGSSNRRTTSNHMKDEFYMNKKTYYVGSQNTTDRIVVQSGEYKYSFSCDIPDECHTSVNEINGFIRYSVTLVIEGDMETKEFVKFFTVIKPLNLNDDKTYCYPMNNEDEIILTKYCCCLCCWLTDPIKVSARIPMRGYAPGQAIEISLNITNKTNQKFVDFTGKIYKKMEFYANNKKSTSEEILATATCEGCPAGETILRKLIITVPPTPPTETSNICSISYELTVKAISDCCDENINMKFPITIGTYPIEKTCTNGIVVTQPPTTPLPNQQESTQEQFHSYTPSEPSQSQPLLSTENIQSPQCFIPDNISAGQSTIDRKPADFRVGESSRSDKDLEKSYRPLYPVYRNNQFPIASKLTIESAEMKPIKL